MSYDELTAADRAMLSRVRVTGAVKALRDFGTRTLGDAAIILPMWRDYGYLSEVERRMVLDQFPVETTEA